MNKIGVLFTDFLLSGEIFGSKRLEVYLDSWTILCENERLCIQVCLQLTKDLLSGRHLFRGNAVIGWIHPVILNVGEDSLRKLVDAVLRCLVTDEYFENFAEFAICLSIVCADKLDSADVVLRRLCESLLEWIERLYLRSSSLLEFAIDGYNYIIGSDKQGLNKITCHRLPEELRKFVLSNAAPAAGLELENTMAVEHILPTLERNKTPDEDASGMTPVNEENPFGEDLGGYATYDGDFWSFE
jgi:hypothetical protein